MVVIQASAPNKMILAGEHGVVYGASALVAPIEVDSKRNRITLTPRSGGFCFQGDLGKSWLQDGEAKGDDVYFPMVSIAQHVAEKVGEPVLSVTADLDFGGSPTGTGNSASISVALAMALFTAYNHVPTRQELYDAGFVGDNAYHGGKSSGLDVTGVLTDQVQRFVRVFANGSATPTFESLDLQMPTGCQLLLVSSDRGAPRPSTAQMIEQYARAHGISKKPTELTDTERALISKPFDAVVETIQSLCRNEADPNTLGAALDENHVLLQSVTTVGIEEALRTAKSAGALGGKLIGAGGEGGALIVLCLDSDIVRVQDALKGRGFQSWPVQLAKRGPSVDDIRPE